MRDVGAQQTNQPEVKPPTDDEAPQRVLPRNERQPGFATVELRFFEEGENLANADGNADAGQGDWTEPTAVRERGRRRRRLATWAALATAGFVAIAILALWRTRGNAEPAILPANVAASAQAAAKVSPPKLDPTVPRP